MQLKIFWRIPAVCDDILLKMSDPANASDLELLKHYTRDRAEDAFAELVRRHVNLVHSAALRQVRSPQLAEEVAQSAFTDLARNAAKLCRGTGVSPVLAAWLYQVTRRTAIDVVRRETRRQLREQIATEMNAMNSPSQISHFAKCDNESEWRHIEPLLDEAMSALDDTDRAAVLLRYFENKSLREVGSTLGTSDDAAQKRVSRAVERLREFFTKRGVTVGASGLVVVISANAVQAAPVGLAVTISTAAALAGTTLATTTTVTNAIATATIAVLAGVGIYEARQTSQLRGQVQTLQQHQAPLEEQVGLLNQFLTDATNQLTVLRDDNERLNRNTSDLLRLRGEITQLRQAKSELVKLQDENQKLRASTQASTPKIATNTNILSLSARSFHIRTNGFLESLNRQLQTEDDEPITTKLKKLFEQNRVSSEPPAVVYFDETKWQIYVRNTITNLDAIEKIIQILHRSDN